MKKKYLFLLIFPFFISCSNIEILKREDVNTILPLPPVNSQNYQFNSSTSAELISVEKNGKIITGYKTDNFSFYNEIIKPGLMQHLSELKALPKYKIINELTIVLFYYYQTFIGKDFYRWGGDILDLDDPQNESIRFQKKYGLDCSGLAVSGYEIAVSLDLIKPEDAVFSSKGFEYFCSVNRDIIDTGGREGTSNNYRIDTKELAYLGSEIIRVEKGNSPSPDQLSLLRASDLVGRNGHFGIIIENNNKLYYIESGGWVVPENDGYPVAIETALTKFASSGSISVRRGLNE